ncbi:MAG: phosphoribosylaminoimidazolesuccinocarboxamide synthase [Propionibacteriaceae bacterium]
MSTPELDLPLIHAGKVRRLYALPDPEQILVVATDAVSAYDVILEPEIPTKGAILTQLSLWWFEQLRDLVPNHVISVEVPEAVRGRAMVCEKLAMLPAECVVRGYITGSGYQDYRRTGVVSGIALPEGLADGDQLDPAIFTPSTKADLGAHDEPVSYEQLCRIMDPELAQELRELSLRIYQRAATIAAERGIILADTKCEFGQRRDGTVVLADEVLTPDSSRFWLAQAWVDRHAMVSFDKQYIRDWLATTSGWDPASGTPAPPLPAAVVEATQERYLEAYRRLTGTDFSIN